jgi:endonuclease/exonuclease/phosphatase family metal-dependent hydrolase
MPAAGLNHEFGGAGKCAGDYQVQAGPRDKGGLWMMNLRIITLNIRRDRHDDGINNWEFRRDLVAGIINDYDPDIAVFQEVLAHQLEDLKKMLPRHQYSGVGRDDGLEAGEFAPIFYRDLPVEEQGTFWMSDTPDRPSRTWPGMIRICTWTTFTGSPAFSVFNTHLEYEFESTQLKSIDLLVKRTGRYPQDYPLFVTGDFNFDPGSLPYDRLSRSFRDSLSVKPDVPLASCHGWTGRTVAVPDQAGRIDYVWHRGNVRIADCRILTENPAEEPGVYPSDHWPVLCDAQLL